MEDKIIALLAQNLLPSKVASIVGCTPEYVSQIKTSPEFTSRLELAKKRYDLEQKEMQAEEGYIRLESKLIHAMEEQIPFAEFGDLTRAMDTLIRRKQKLTPNGSIVVNHTNNIKMVSVQLPKAAAPELLINSEGEAVAIDGKSLAPMSSVGVRNLFSDLARKKKEAIDAEIVPSLTSDVAKQKPSKQKKHGELHLDSEDDSVL